LDAFILTFVVVCGYPSWHPHTLGTPPLEQSRFHLAPPPLQPWESRRNT